MFRKPASADDYIRTANETVLVIAQIETRLGVENAGAIAAVPGVGALLVGPNDLASLLA